MWTNGNLKITRLLKTERKYKLYSQYFYLYTHSYTQIPFCGGVRSLVFPMHLDNSQFNGTLLPTGTLGCLTIHNLPLFLAGTNRSQILFQGPLPAIIQIIKLLLQHSYTISGSYTSSASWQKSVALCMQNASELHKSYTTGRRMLSKEQHAHAVSPPPHICDSHFTL